ncbi:SDR family NAD(P)-dependent oxidoreductase [Paenibacillus sp. UMB4589-SE434]|uniref:type I polyketide synthase n=1 Tax=Paenibacillus sp. UMB4589-SE434 TaxID=3046314 RepID=UPI00254E1984|nr:SDR family NAD(P)-dependent oxidoreductase [Paenibacillus sp. UMB4589-SE434]MDK8179810.1 SDR family NAD(P)-dependent oxidoreductase [Paenibacillus sp. UMB4589-SE434]
MSKLRQTIFDYTVAGKMDKRVGVELLTLLKQEETGSPHDIAVIGMSFDLPGANGDDALWDVLEGRQDCIRPFPDARLQDVAAMLEQLGMTGLSLSECGYLDEIDKFDYDFFRLSPKEASLMDPHQRLFLETAWKTIEDAGYGGSRLKGSRTGVYVGYNGWPLYERMITSTMPGQAQIATAGNVSSIIASRIAYLLDLHGPSLLVDTACSSSLVAVHLAVRAIRSGECDMAIAGGVKLNLLPMVHDKNNIGIHSTDFRTKSFDASSDGTGWGEGVASVLLKPLDRALADGDVIHAVIKGSATNQDGNSNGITAPNARAQEDCIVRAWEDAGITPDTIRYVEAHGTGTKLGDPIEIEGIKRAFGRYSVQGERRPIGTVKSNIGHLDSAAGIAGLVKSIVMLKQRKLPPLLHYVKPNSQINFEDSPVFVNTETKVWEGDGPLRVGISSFGLSGTNCHLILEEAPLRRPRPGSDLSRATPYVLTLSARSQQSLEAVVTQYINASGLWDKQSASDYHDEPNTEFEKLSSICYISNTGRGHYEYRLALIVSHLTDVAARLNEWRQQPTGNRYVYFGQHKLTTRKKEDGIAITEVEQRELGRQASEVISHALTYQTKEQTTVYMEHLQQLAVWYVRGAQVPWEELYSVHSPAAIRLPVYPFERKRCWLDASWLVTAPPTTGREDDAAVHPLLERLAIRTFDEEVFITSFHPDRHWVLSDHRVLAFPTIPGTTYIEMARKACSAYVNDDVLEFSNVYFHTPMVFRQSQAIETHTIVRRVGSGFEFRIVSKQDKHTPEAPEWLVHATGAITVRPKKMAPVLDVTSVRSRLEQQDWGANYEVRNPAIQFGRHWTDIRFEEVYKGENELLLHLSLPECYDMERLQMPFHPALMDVAITFCGDMITSGMYLPFMYEGLRVYGEVPSTLYSYIRMEPSAAEDRAKEVVRMKVTICDEAGNVVVDVDHFTQKKVRQIDTLRPDEPHLFRKEWVTDSYQGNEAVEGNEVIESLNPGETVLLFTDQSRIAKDAADELRHQDIQVIEVEIGTCFSRTASGFTVGAAAADYEELIAAIRDHHVSYVLHMLLAGEQEPVDTLLDLHKRLDDGVYSLYHLIRSFVKLMPGTPVHLAEVLRYADIVTGDEPYLQPDSYSLTSLMKVISQEHHHIHTACIDLDDYTPASVWLQELASDSTGLYCAYRNGIRYAERFGVVPAASLDRQPLEYRSDGVYVITGGTGGLGLEVANYLAGCGARHLVLLNRSGCPEPAHWEAILSSSDQPKTARVVRALMELKQQEVEVAVQSVDLSNMDDLRTCFQDIRERYGAIHGLFHCAGVAGEGVITRKSVQSFAGVMSPKVEGTWLLDQVTSEDQLDIMVLFSSFSSIVGGYGQADYATANGYMDGYAKLRSLRGRRTLSINWPAWSDVGMAVDYNVDFHSNILHAVSTKQGLAMLEELMDMPITNAIAGNINWSIALSAGISAMMPLSIELESWMKESALQLRFTDKQQAVHEQTGTACTVSLLGTTAANETEQGLARVWGELFGRQEIDIDDSFYDLGGDSILAITMLPQLERLFPGTIDISDLFMYPTIRELSKYIEDQREQARNQEAAAADEKHMIVGTDVLEEFDLDELLTQVEQGSVSVDSASDRLHTVNTHSSTNS